MRFKNIIKLLALVAFAFVAVSFSTNRASASAKKYYISSYPKIARGTWHLRYKSKHENANVDLKITKNRMIFIDNNHNDQAILELHNIHDKHVKVKKNSYIIPVYAVSGKKNGQIVFYNQKWGTKKSKKPKVGYYVYSDKGTKYFYMYNLKSGRVLIFTKSLALEKQINKYQDMKVK
ncbi:hypothetical protein [Apilactobacillus zhangqiuensis]|uniref:hypothetical protein n=1 Tax=Apilactobacillus zhangqiuensis TaxID=2841031 RepID=UPI001C7D57D3|nr:hypothetical protein [Apilactobacillus zhangqiuensis]